MNSDQLRYLTSCFNGQVFALDEINDLKFQEDSYLIFNTDSGIGEHWVSCCIKFDKKTKSNTIFYYDSLGLPPVLRTLVAFINNNINGELVFNKYPHQSANSSYCGLYCILFLSFMFRNKKFEEFLNLFSSNVSANDKWIKNFFDTHAQNSIKGQGQICRSILRSELLDKNHE